MGANFRNQSSDRRVAAAVADQIDPAADAEPTVRLTDSLRTETFSDGVLAITTTLLAVELGQPSYEPGRLLAALVDEWPAYLAVVVSFVYVGAVWLHHHALFSRIRSMDAGLQWMNLTILLAVAVLPFPTGVLAEALADGDATDVRVAVGLYALVGAVITATWTPVYPYLRRHPHLLERESDAASFGIHQERAWTGVVLYAIAAVVGITFPVLGLAVFAVGVAFRALTVEVVTVGRLPSGRRSRTDQVPRHIHIRSICNATPAGRGEEGDDA